MARTWAMSGSGNHAQDKNRNKLRGSLRFYLQTPARRTNRNRDWKGIVQGSRSHKVRREICDDIRQKDIDYVHRNSPHDPTLASQKRGASGAGLSGWVVDASSY